MTVIWNRLYKKHLHWAGQTVEINRFSATNCGQNVIANNKYKDKIYVCTVCFSYLSVLSVADNAPQTRYIPIHYLGVNLHKFICLS